jgi:hypothetical protein
MCRERKWNHCRALNGLPVGLITVHLNFRGTCQSDRRQTLDLQIPDRQTPAVVKTVPLCLTS